MARKGIRKKRTKRLALRVDTKERGLDQLSSSELNAFRNYWLGKPLKEAKIKKGLKLAIEAEIRRKLGFSSDL